MSIKIDDSKSNLNSFRMKPVIIGAVVVTALAILVLGALALCGHFSHLSSQVLPQATHLKAAVATAPTIAENLKLIWLIGFTVLAILMLGCNYSGVRCSC